MWDTSRCASALHYWKHPIFDTSTFPHGAFPTPFLLFIRLDGVSFLHSPRSIGCIRQISGGTSYRPQLMIVCDRPSIVFIRMFTGFIYTSTFSFSIPYLTTTHHFILDNLSLPKSSTSRCSLLQFPFGTILAVRTNVLLLF